VSSNAPWKQYKILVLEKYNKWYRFSSLTSSLETKCRNYQPKKAASVSRNDVSKFLLNAADQEWILQKVVLMMAVIIMNYVK
jgi:hypothetical protein